MALICCPECTREISDKAAACPHCGFPIASVVKEPDKPESLEKKQMICQFCGRENDEGSKYCGYCGRLIDPVEIQRRTQLQNLRTQTENIAVQKKQFNIQQQQLQVQQQMYKQQQREYRNTARCPRCGSTSLSGNKKGFGIGKALVGAALVGPFGLVAGNLGAKKVKVTCLKCGKQFWA